MRGAAVEMKQGHVVCDQPVEVMLPNGRLTANGMVIPESCMVIRFNPRVVLMRDAAEAVVAAK
jgi:hypothetical protein